MGMDVFGNSGNYFRASIWSWRAIILALTTAGFVVPVGWGSNDGHGLNDQKECDTLATKLETFLNGWDGNELVLQTTSVAVDKSGRFVPLDHEEARSPYWTDRAHLEEFVTFLRACGGFEIR